MLVGRAWKHDVAMAEMRGAGVGFQGLRDRGEFAGVGENLIV